MTDSDRSHLRILEILHYVQAGLWVVMVVWSGVSMLFFRSFFDRTFENALGGSQGGRTVVEVAPVEPGEPVPQPPPTPQVRAEVQQFQSTFDGFLVTFVAVQAVWGVLACAATLAAGLCLRRRRNRPVIYVAGALNLLNVPVGTALAVFTFIVLERPAVKAAFGASQ